MRVLWLASWYPNKYEPYNGDFIQRHAIAVSKVCPIDVIHVVQLGKDGVSDDAQEVHHKAGLRELICYFRFKKWGIGPLDKIRYNIRYLQKAKQVLLQYEKEHGRPDIIHVHVPIKAGITARKIAAQWNIPYIVSEQASYYEQAAPNRFSKRSIFFRYNAKKIFKNAAAVTNVSATLGATIKTLFRINKVITVHNSADTSMFCYDGFELKDEFIWLHVSALNHQKNIDGMLKAFSQLKAMVKWKLVVVGPDSHEHHQLVNHLGLHHQVTFTGELSHQQVAVQMKQAHAFVLFSRHENFPCVIVESLCSGLPVVAADAGGVQEAINNSNGKVVSSENIDQLATELKNLMDNYRSFNPRKIAADAAARYNSKLIAEQFVNIYHEAVARHKA